MLKGNLIPVHLEDRKKKKKKPMPVKCFHHHFHSGLALSNELKLMRNTEISSDRRGSSN